jgi:hypothetical protein
MPLKPNLRFRVLQFVFSNFPNEAFYAKNVFLVSTLRATCSIYLILDLFSLIIFSEWCKLCNFLYHASFIVLPNIVFSLTSSSFYKYVNLVTGVMSYVQLLRLS